MIHLQWFHSPLRNNPTVFGVGSSVNSSRHLHLWIAARIAITSLVLCLFDPEGSPMFLDTLSFLLSADNKGRRATLGYVPYGNNITDDGL